MIRKYIWKKKIWVKGRPKAQRSDRKHYDAGERFPKINENYFRYSLKKYIKRGK
jgi:hypothetical protein